MYIFNFQNSVKYAYIYACDFFFLLPTDLRGIFLSIKFLPLYCWSQT